MEFFEGTSLNVFLKKQQKKRIDEYDAKKIMKQLIEAVAYCHSKEITHRDIKLENVLLKTRCYQSNVDYEIKLIDFGFS